MTLEELQQQMATMPPADREKLLAALFRDYQGEEDVLGKQRQQAGALRAAPDPRMRQAGGFQIASNPLEFYGQNAQRAVGEYGLAQNNQALQGISQNKSAATRALAAALARMPTVPEQLNPRGGI